MSNLSINQAAEKVGKSTRQVMRYVKDGRLPPVAGGGNGIPYEFDQATVAALQNSIRRDLEFRARRSEPQNIFPPDFMARLFWFGDSMRYGDRPAGWQAVESGSVLIFGDFWRDGQRLLEKALPQLEDVPESIHSGIAHLLKSFTERERRLVAGIVFAILFPRHKSNQSGSDLIEDILAGLILSGEFDSVSDAQSTMFTALGFGQSIQPDFRTIKEFMLNRLHHINKARSQVARPELKKEHVSRAARVLFQSASALNMDNQDLGGAGHGGDMFENYSDDERKRNSKELASIKAREDNPGATNSRGKTENVKAYAVTLGQVAEKMNLHRQQVNRDFKSMRRKLGSMYPAFLAVVFQGVDPDRIPPVMR